MNLEVNIIPPPERLAAVCGNRHGIFFLAWRSSRSRSYNFLAVPFLLLFVVGYIWAGFGTLYQEHQGRLQWLKQQKLALAKSSGA